MLVGTVLTTLLASRASATLTDYVFTQVPNEGWGVGVAPERTNSFCLNDGNYAPVGYYVQKLRGSAVGDALLPPTTNLYSGDTNSYCQYPTSMGGNGTPPQSGWYSLVGDDDLTWGLSDAGRPGRITTSVDGAGSQFGILRLFSATTVTGAAYFGDVVPERPLTGGDAFTASPVQTSANRVNSAYKMYFTYYPTNVAGTGWIVTGAVYATTGGHTNQLQSVMVKVDWRYSSDAVWQAGTGAVGANGQFWFTPGITGPTAVYVRACVKDAYCQAGRTNLPATTSYLGGSGLDTLNGYGPVYLALAPPPFVVITNVAQTVNYTVNSTAVGGSNNPSVVALWWSNNLTSAGGGLALGNPWWTTNGIGLAVGANVITVYGTNALGAASSSSVTITRRDVTTGTPFVHVTNGARSVLYDVTTGAIGGSNNPSVVALWWSNSLNATGGTLAPGSPWWTINGIGLAVGGNLISVYGTNALGAASSSSVTITRRDVTTGMPFVDITNQSQLASITLPFRVAGTNNQSVVGLMWISNSANGQAVAFPASQSWTSASVNLVLLTNTIYVFGSNAVSNVTNDTVVVLGVPEAVGLGCIAVLLPLAARRRLSS